MPEVKKYFSLYLVHLQKSYITQARKPEVYNGRICLSQRLVYKKTCWLNLDKPRTTTAPLIIEVKISINNLWKTSSVFCEFVVTIALAGGMWIKHFQRGVRTRVRPFLYKFITSRAHHLIPDIKDISFVVEVWCRWSSFLSFTGIN